MLPYCVENWDYGCFRYLMGKGILNMIMNDNIFFDVTKIDVTTLC